MGSNKSSDDYGHPDRAVLTTLIGESAKARILSVLLKEAHRDLSVKEIADLAGVHQSTAYEPIEELERLDVVVESRQVANSTLYRVNTENPVVKKLKQVEDEIVRQTGSSSS